MSLQSALDIMSALVLGDGARWGEKAADFQWSDAKAVLDVNGPPYAYLTRSRGASKTDDLAGMLIAAMTAQLGDGSRCYGAASDRDQAKLLLDSFAGFARRTPILTGQFDIGTWRATHLASGSTLDILSADAPSAWGLRPAFTVVDEIAAWAETTGPKQLWEALSTASAKHSDSGLAVISSAGSPSHWSFKVLEHAKRDPLWYVHEVPGPAPWLNPEKLEEQRRRLPESSYRRLFLNQWTESEDMLTAIEDLRACVVLDGPLDWQMGRDYLIALDVGLKHDRTCAVVCHAERLEDGRDGYRVVLDRIQVWQGSRLNPVRLETVEEWILQAAHSYYASNVVLDPWQSIGLAQRLRDRGLSVKEFNFTSASVGKLATSLHLALRNRALALPDDEELFDELSRVRLRETSPGCYRLDHDEGQHDDRAVALAMCVHQLLDRAVPVPIPALAFGFDRASPWREPGAELVPYARTIFGGSS